MKFLRVVLLLLIAFAVLSFGAVDVWSQSILEAGAGLLLFIWAVIARLNPETKIRWTPLNWPLLGFVVIAGLQLLFHGTASPFLTRTEILRLGAYFALFFLFAQAYRTRSDWVGLAWFVIGFCFAVSLFGIAQHFTSGNEIYWMQSFKTDVKPFGPYVNRNDFAGFVELTLPIGLALMIFRGAHKDLFPLLTLFTVVPISAAILSSSRGGITSIAFEIAVLLLLAIRWRGASRKRRDSRKLAFGLIALVALSFIAWVGVGRTIERFSSLDHPAVTFSRRISMARGAVRIFLAHPIKGCGLGALVDVFPLYETAYDGRVVDHVHNDYLEALAEAGILGGICGLSFLWLLYREARRNLGGDQGKFSRALHAGAAAAVCGLLLHSFVDFNLHIPANALLFLLQVSILASPPLPPAASPRSRQPVSEGECEGKNMAVSP
ncbi:MAG: O-antigen ligase family protein [Candidatus Acidiferrales bacterium]